jgi:hypothetical protein
MATETGSPEHARLAVAREAGWYEWGPYLSERQWGTVREDYSADGSAWSYLPHDQARSRAYRWGEDGLAGLSDRRQQLCFALALWNGRDPILKERLFGLSGPEGNHGEDVKECYYYLDATPTHSYQHFLYKYPQLPFPYAELVAENARRGREQSEYELLDTGVFDQGYWDVEVEYAKAGPHDILIRIRLANRGDTPASLHLLPTLWFRNTWSWGRDPRRPQLARAPAPAGLAAIAAEHHALGPRLLVGPAAQLLFSDNDTNFERLYGRPNPSPYVKDAFHRWVVDGEAAAVNPAETGTKAALHLVVSVPAGAGRELRLRLARPEDLAPDDPLKGFAAVCDARRAEADAFYAAIAPAALSAEERRVHRQALAGMLWSKQTYRFEVAEWLQGDPAYPPPPAARRLGRNREWGHLDADELLAMPDKWEYPWFAAWDLAFHAVVLAQVDPYFARQQLIHVTREWYMHPNGQLPAYEWAFGDVNPPVHAWAAWRVYQIEQRRWGRADRAFLERQFHKLLLNFTWWVNRKDAQGRNVFQGGFLGLDNIGVFDRSAPLPTGGHIEQADGTSWMGLYCLTMMAIALELARENPVYEDIATKFLEHFLYIAQAMNNIAEAGIQLWDPADEFFYDVLHVEDRQALVPLKVRSMVGLIPLFAVEVLEPEVLARSPGFARRLEWFLSHRPELATLVSRWQEPGVGERRLFALLRGHRMKRVLRRMLDEQEFLSPYGVRALSRVHAAHPYTFSVDGESYTVSYQPGESLTGLFGGNSNWRGPVWLPVNFLIVEALQKFHHYYGDDFHVECPTGSGRLLTLAQIAAELAGRLIALFLPDAAGRRPIHGDNPRLQHDPHWRDLLLFHEYFHGDSGQGLGAAHQTGWTALVATLIAERARGR